MTHVKFLSLGLIFFFNFSVFAQDITRVAVIGDFGMMGPAQEQVSDLVKSLNPEIILTTGDNNYPRGEVHTIDKNIGQYYAEFIHPYFGSFGQGALENRFFPTLGNHDWMSLQATAHLQYFTLPGNERYYDIVRGSIHFFMIDSDRHEPDGIDAGSKQALWLKEKLRASTSPWKLVLFHHSPFSSGPHGSSPTMQWPFKEWGASAVLTGHDHVYERIFHDGFVYFVNGLGGAPIYPTYVIYKDSVIRYNKTHGAQLIEATPEKITFQFISTDREIIDSFDMNH